MKLNYVNKQTGEIIDLKAKFNQETDRSTMVSTNLNLTPQEVVSLRSTTNTLTSIQMTLGIATGVVLGKGIFTGVCIAVGSAIIYDALTPTDLIYKRVLTFKTK